MHKKILKIEEEFYSNGSSFEKYEFRAIGLDGKRIFGMSADVSRHNRSWSQNRVDWTEWVCSWSSCGCEDSNERPQIAFEVISKAMEHANALNGII